jgi:AcrR family transcriptional regulator
VDNSVKGGRAYRTTLRQEQAHQTRRRILDAARRLFVMRGFSQVTMQDIADDAGVAYQTVYAQFGTKIRLAVELCDSEVSHVAGEVALFATAREGDDAERLLTALGRFARRLYEPCADVLRFMRESGDPELLGRYKAIQRRRLDLLQGIGPQLERAGHLRQGLSGADAVDLMWTLAGPETYEQLVLDRGWTPERFERWLGAALLDLIRAS